MSGRLGALIVVVGGLYAVVTCGQTTSETQAMQDILNAIGYSSVKASSEKCDKLSTATGGKLRVTCTNLHPTSVVINDARVASIPSSVSLLLNLTSLVISHNKLSGGITPEIGKLPNLQTLDLSHNQLYGPVPKTVAMIQHLIWLDLSFNQLNGSILPLQTVADYLYLDYSSNRFTGNIPSPLANTFIYYLNVSNNLLTGTYRSASAVQSLRNTRVFVPTTDYDLSNNFLSGPIPSAFLDNFYITADLRGNYFTGKLNIRIPATCGQLKLGNNCLLRSPYCVTSPTQQRSARACDAFCHAGVWNVSSVPCSGRGVCVPGPSRGSFRCANCTRGPSPDPLSCK